MTRSIASLVERMAARLANYQHELDTPRWQDRDDPAGDELERQERLDRAREKGE